MRSSIFCRTAEPHDECPQFGCRGAAFCGAAHEQLLGIGIAHVFSASDKAVFAVLRGFDQIVERVDDVIVVRALVPPAELENRRGHETGGAPSQSGQSVCLTSNGQGAYAECGSARQFLRQVLQRGAGSRVLHAWTLRPGVIGVALLLVGRSSPFAEVQNALDRIWARV